MNRTQQLLMVLGMSLLWATSATAAPREGAAPATAKSAAKPSAAAHRAKVEEALGLYGVKDQLAQFPALLEAQMAREKGQFDPELHGQLTGILVDSYQGEVLYAHVLRHFETYAEPARPAPITRQSVRMTSMPDYFSGWMAWSLSDLTDRSEGKPI